ncbi:MAG: hypothetical protein JST00_26490 [Deltaproteobacteria bacterium]|nr:hypothetical protein [Deltaproteobacteria bacterium]
MPLFQDWIAIEGSGTTPFVQTRADWLDLGPFSDVVLWLEVRAVANPGAGNVSLTYETSPSLDESTFQPIASALTLAAAAGPVVTKVLLSSNPAVPLARFLRWRLVGTAAGAWSVSFRIHVMAQRGLSGGFDPSSLALTGWWRASYGGAPWSGTASAGASGARSLTTAGSDPATGAALNGLAGADFDGTANLLTTGLAGSALFAPSALSFWALVDADTVPADPGAGLRWQGSGLIGDSGATYLQVALTAAGATLGVTSSGAYDEVTTACSTGAPHLVQARFDGTSLSVRVDAGAWQSVPATNGPGATIDDLSNVIRVGLQIGYFDGRMWELGLADSVMSDSAFEQVRSYVNARYALSL